MRPSELSFTPDQKAVWERLRAQYLQQGRWEMIQQVSDLVVTASIEGWTDARFEARFRDLFQAEAEKWKRVMAA